MSLWALNKEQKEGSGGLLVAQGGSLPAPSKDGSVLKAFPPFQPETFALDLWQPSPQRSRGGFFIGCHTMQDHPLLKALSCGHLRRSMFNMNNRDHRGSQIRDAMVLPLLSQRGLGLEFVISHKQRHKESPDELRGWLGVASRCLD